MVSPFDQVIEAWGDGSLLVGQVGTSPTLWECGGICGTAARLWIDFAANPERAKHRRIKFKDIFSPAIALDEDEGKDVVDYDGNPVPTCRGLTLAEKRMAPVFQIQEGSRFLTNRSPLFHDDDVPAIYEWLNRHLPHVKGDDRTGRYVYMYAQHEDSGHLLGIAKPKANVDEYRMFDPNIGEFRGNKIQCANWLRMQFQAKYSTANGWGGIFERAFVYMPEHAIARFTTGPDGRRKKLREPASKHYVHYPSSCSSPKPKRKGKGRKFKGSRDEVVDDMPLRSAATGESTASSPSRKKKGARPRITHTAESPPPPKVRSTTSKSKKAQKPRGVKKS